MHSCKLTILGAAFVSVMMAAGCARPNNAFTGKSASPLGVYPASQSMTQKYGIVEWRAFFGKTQLVVTGYKADGSPVRGVQLAWFKATQQMPGHTRVMMLDGTNATLRRLVGGAKTGQLSKDQLLFIETIRYDLMRSKTSATVKGSSLGGGGGLRTQALGSGLHTQGVGAPDQGPDCQAAQADGAQSSEALACGVDIGTLAIDAEDPKQWASVGISCTKWYEDYQHTQSVCSAENTTSCVTDTDGTQSCNFPDQSSGNSSASPQQSCDAQCLCAVYPDSAQGCAQVGPCSADSDCSNGQTCQSGSSTASKTCQVPPADQVTDNNTATSNTASSCGSGDVSSDASNGQVGCSDGSSGSGGSSNNPTDTSTDDPNASNSGGGGSSGNSGNTCANDGDSCSQDSDCCSSACSSGTCGGGGGSNTCANDGDSCSQDSDCCSSSCTNGTCGNGMCANDGDACSQDSDCCNGTCSNGTCGSSSSTCGNPGDPCSMDSDCCSQSCDQNSGSCN